MAFDSADGPGGAVVPEQFVKQVKGALEHLYDFPYLERLPLAQHTSPSEGSARNTAGQRLRRELLEAIETLHPGADVPFRATRGRLHNLLVLHYVEAMTVQEAASELAISRRQAHRDLRRGEESVAAVLWAHWSPAEASLPQAAQLTSAEAELARLEDVPRPTDVVMLVESACLAVRRLALQRQVTIELESPPAPVTVATNTMIARHVLINALTHAVSEADAGSLTVTIDAQLERPAIGFRYRPAPDAQAAFAMDSFLKKMVDRLEWQIDKRDLSDASRELTLVGSPRCPTILVIDDNEGLLGLLSDYLTDHACQVVATTSGREGLRLAQQTRPDAIILDVMMPEIDGWELLQRLRVNSQTAVVPIIVCSVVNNPELANSLGASLYLPKPVSRDDILAGLHRLGVV